MDLDLGRAARVQAPATPLSARRALERPVRSVSGAMVFGRLPRESGGATGARTPDLLHAMQMLSQLSYRPVCEGQV